MTPRKIYLIKSRNASFQRAHFSIFVPSQTNSELGTLINIVGAPMAGYKLEFERNHIPASRQSYEIFPLADVDSSNIVDSTTDEHSIDDIPRGNIEIAATQVAPPGMSENFLAPVNDTTNRRCQEWTMEYVRHLVAKRLISTDVVQVVQSKRDPPTHGIGLKAAATVHR